MYKYLEFSENKSVLNWTFGQLLCLKTHYTKLDRAFKLAWANSVKNPSLVYVYTRLYVGKVLDWLYRLYSKRVLKNCVVCCRI